jgi:hypothetical protein
MAEIGTLAAGADALVHPAHALAIVGAGRADFRAQAAGQEMAFGTADHEIRRGAANLRAVRHEGQEGRAHVFPPDWQAQLVDGLGTNIVAEGAGFDAARQVVAVDAGMGVDYLHGRERVPITLLPGRD